MVIFMKFLQIKVETAHRLMIARKDNFLKVDKQIVILQGLFAPYVVPKCECLPLDCSGQMV